MAQQSFAGLAVLIALAFAIMALNACASSEHAAQASSAVVALPGEPEMSAPEFHGASIGADSLRSRLESEA
ncbi:MAG: hypothetical protein AB7H66_01535 [Hyphomonadaceae bacterium]